MNDVLARARLLAKARRSADQLVAAERPDGRSAASFGQEQQWFLHHLDSGDLAAYIVPFALRLHGPLDVDALRSALGSVLHRHSVLRSHFELQDGEVRQVTTDLEIPLPVLEAEDEESARRTAVALTREKFDLTAGPLVRMALLVLGPHDHVLVWVAHHAVADGWSVGVLIDELGAAYRGEELPTLPVQYADFAEWQRERLTGSRMDALADRWRARLAGAPPASVPADLPRPPVQTFRGDTIGFTLPADVGDSLANLCARNETTMYMTLLAGLQVLLMRYGEADSVVGAAFAGRLRREAEPLIGPFATTVALRLDASGDPTFTELLGRVKTVLLEAFADQEIPFGSLVRALGQSRDSSRNPVYQVLFSMGSLPLGTGEVALTPELAVRPIGLPNGTSRLDLELTMEQTGSALAGRLDYNTDLFLPETAQRLVDQFRTVLAGAVRAPDRPISEIALIDDPGAVLASWAQPDRVLPITGLLSRFARMVRERPGQEAVRSGGEVLSYRELDHESDRVAHSVLAAGAGPGTVVAVAADRDLTLVPTLLGVLKAGATYLPLDPDFPVERLRYMVRDSRASLLIGQAGVDLPVLSIVDDSPVLPAEDLDRVAYVMYTSGSTGTPKGVAVSHRALGNFIGAMDDLGVLEAGDRTLALARLPFDGSVSELFLPLAVGATIVIGQRSDARDARRLVTLLDEHEITVLHGTPATWRLLLDAGWQGGSVRRLLSGAEALTPTLSARLRERVPEVWNMYGPTETTVWSFAHRVTSDGVPPIGRPIANTTAFVLDERGRPVPPGVVGELHIGGASLSDGYLNITTDRFDHDRYRTGDLVVRLADGTLSYRGRTDDQVKLRGHRVELGEIESVLGRHPSVRDAVALVHRFGEDDDRLVAYVVADEGHQIDEAAVRTAAATALPEHMLPARIVPLDSFPLTPSGKIDRKALAAQSVPVAAASTAYDPPSTPTERWMARLWEELLGRERIGVHDDFFLAGGHSLLAVKILYRVRERCGADLPLDRFFAAPSVAGVAAEIDQALSEGADADLASRVDEMSDEEVARLLASTDYPAA